MTFVANPKTVAASIRALEYQPGGGRRTPDDQRLEAYARKWAERPGSNAFIFWDTVYKELSNDQS